MNEKLLETMMRHVDIDDAEELHDVLVMLAQTVDEQAEEIEQLKRRVERVNATLPSTAMVG